MNTHIKNIRESVLLGCVEVKTSVATITGKIAAHPRLSGMMSFYGASLVIASRPALALAAGGSGCKSDAATTLVKFVKDAAKFMIGIGGAVALLMLAVGAFMIIVGGTPDRVAKGMKIIKNVVIGLIVLSGGLLVSFIVTSFVEGAAGNKADNSNCVDSKGFN